MEQHILPHHPSSATNDNNTIIDRRTNTNVSDPELPVYMHSHPPPPPNNPSMKSLTAGKMMHSPSHETPYRSSHQKNELGKDSVPSSNLPSRMVMMEITVEEKKGRQWRI